MGLLRKSKHLGFEQEGPLSSVFGGIPKIPWPANLFGVLEKKNMFFSLNVQVVGGEKNKKTVNDTHNKLLVGWWRDSECGLVIHIYIYEHK